MVYMIDYLISEEARNEAHADKYIHKVMINCDAKIPTGYHELEIIGVHGQEWEDDYEEIRFATTDYRSIVMSPLFRFLMPNLIDALFSHSGVTWKDEASSDLWIPIKVTDFLELLHNDELLVNSAGTTMALSIDPHCFD